MSQLSFKIHTLHSNTKQIKRKKKNHEIDIQLKSFEELVVLGFGPTLPRLGDSVRFASLLSRVLEGIGGGGSGGKREYSGERHSRGVHVVSLRRVGVFRYHVPPLSSSFKL